MNISRSIIWFSGVGINAMVNPIVYYFRMERFKADMHGLWSKCFSLGKPTRTNTKAISRTKDTGVTFSNLVQTAVVGVSKRPSCKAKE